MFFQQMHPIWQLWLPESKQLLDEIEGKLSSEEDVTPERNQVMRAFNADPRTIRAVILGQDPYPTKGDAVGYAFAVNQGHGAPKSLVNIFKELETDLGMTVNKNRADISCWVDRGVFLLNTSLTTRVGEPSAHSSIGWQEFTTAALKALADQQDFVILAWGNHAKQVSKAVVGPDWIIESSHPSPLSAHRGFLGSRPYSRANSVLIENRLEPIDWSLT